VVDFGILRGVDDVAGPGIDAVRAMAQGRPPSQAGRYQPAQLLHGYQEGKKRVAPGLHERDGKVVSDETAGPG
jgi:hypothetical protein